jgi:hypothetical protein
MKLINVSLACGYQIILKDRKRTILLGYYTRSFNAGIIYILFWKAGLWRSQVIENQDRGSETGNSKPGTTMSQKTRKQSYKLHFALKNIKSVLTSLL